MLNNPSKIRPAKSHVARQLILYIVLFSSFITIFTTAVQLYRDYNTDLNLIHSELQQIHGVHLDSLSSALWAANRELLQTSIDGILKIRDMQYVEIRDDEQVWARAGKNIEENTIRRQYSMKYRHRNKDVIIGNLTVVVSLAGVYQRLIDKVWVILVSNAVKTTLVATFIYFLFLQLVARHLSKISRFAENADPLHTNQPLTLDRNTKRYDEFDVLVDSINDMHNRLHEKIIEADHQKQHLALTLSSIGDAVITTDADGNVTHMNPVAEQLTGWSLEETQRKSLKSLFPIIDASTRLPIENPVDKVIATGETVYLSNHTTLIAKDGTEYQIADSAAPIRDGDEILGMVLVFNDVTENYRLRIAAAKSAQGLVDAQRLAHIGNWELDLVTNTLTWSDEIYRIFEIDPKAFSPSYEAFLNAIHPADRERVNNAYTKSLKNKTPYSIKHRLRMPDGRIKHVVERCQTFYNDAGDPVCSTGTVQDITDQSNLEEAVRRSQKMDALGKLTGGIAHDYNNMLSVILGYTGLLTDSIEGQSHLATYIEQIQHAADRGVKLTKKLLTFSRHKATDAKSVNINTLLLDAQHMLEKTLTTRIQLILNLAEDLWPTWLDSGDLEDSIVNICINAMHAIESNGEVTLRTSNETLNKNEAELLHISPGDYVLLNITDTGCGMNKETREKIFDPFFSTKGSRGTGLGLSQVYGFIKRSSGTIKVYSEEGQGTRFVLYFPRSDKPADDAQAPARDENHNLQGTETVLVVDDEPSILALAKEILSSQGYRVLITSDGEQALKILKQERIELIISDVIMPNMDGYQLAAQVQKHYPNIKLQMVSGFADDRHNGITNDALHQNMLYKPYTSTTLLQHVRRLLDKPFNQSNKSAAENRGNNQPTIMVVDDEQDTLKLFQLFLEKMGYKTTLACNDGEAVGFYQQSLDSGDRIDAIIMDINIPGGMGGVKLAEKIHALDPKAKIIVSSGHTEGPEMTQFEDYGFQGALEKNFDRKKIKQVLDRILAAD